MTGTLLYIRHVRRQETVDERKAEMAMERIQENMERSERVRQHDEAVRMSPRKATQVPLTRSRDDLAAAAGGSEAAADSGSMQVGRQPRPAKKSGPTSEEKAEARRRQAEEKARAARKEERARARQERKAAQKAKRHEEREAVRAARAQKREAAAAGAAQPADNTASGRETAKRAEEWRILFGDLEIPLALCGKLIEYRIKVSDLPDLADDELAELVPDPPSCRKLRRVAEAHIE